MLESMHNNKTTMIHDIIRDVEVDIKNNFNSFGNDFSSACEVVTQKAAAMTLASIQPEINKASSSSYVPSGMKVHELPNWSKMNMKGYDNNSNSSSLAAVTNLVCYNNNMTSKDKQNIFCPSRMSAPLSLLGAKNIPVKQQSTIVNTSNRLRIQQRVCSDKFSGGVGGSVPKEVVKRIVLTAASLVANEIRSGDWDFRKTSADGTGADRHMIADAIEEFANRVMLPSLLKSSVKSLGKHRIFIGSLSILWEVLMQNSSKIFGKEFDANNTTEYSSSDDSSFSGSEEMDDDTVTDDDTDLDDEISSNGNDNNSYKLSDVCAAVIFAAIENSTANRSNSKNFKNAFERVISSYSVGNRKFVLRLEPIHVDVTTDLSNSAVSSGLTRKLVQPLRWKVQSYPVKN